MTAMLTREFSSPQTASPALRLSRFAEVETDAGLYAEPEVAASRFVVADNIQDVLTAWRLVYNVYVRSGFIAPHHFGYHASSAAVGEQAAVVRHMQGQRLIATLTTMRDAGHGLPLDELYRTELDDLRDQGRVLTEAGMLADCGDPDATSMESIFSLMSYALAFSFMGTGTDLVIGVHPRHGRFYQRAYGFDQIGELRSYAAVNNRPCVLMRLKIETATTRRFMPRGLAAWRDQGVTASDFAGRYRFRHGGFRTPFFNDYLAFKRQASTQAIAVEETRTVTYTFASESTAPVMRGLAVS